MPAAFYDCSRPHNIFYLRLQDNLKKEILSFIYTRQKIRDKKQRKFKSTDDVKRRKRNQTRREYLKLCIISMYTSACTLRKKHP